MPRSNTSRSGTQRNATDSVNLLLKRYRQPNVTFTSTITNLYGNVTGYIKNAFQLFAPNAVTQIVMDDMQSNPNLNISQIYGDEDASPEFVEEIPYQVYPEDAPMRSGEMQLYTLDAFPNGNNTALIQEYLRNKYNPTIENGITSTQIMGIAGMSVLVCFVILLGVYGARYGCPGSKEDKAKAKPVPKKIRILSNEISNTTDQSLIYNSSATLTPSQNRRHPDADVVVPIETTTVSSTPIVTSSGSNKPDKTPSNNRTSQTNSKSANRTSVTGIAATTFSTSKSHNRKSAEIALTESQRRKQEKEPLTQSTRVPTYTS